MNDMSQVIIPKSDQINADDLIAGPRTYTVEAIAISPGTEQPVSIKMIGEQRVWRPCKSMSRVLVSAWGPDAKAYIGRSVTLYRDPKVKWGGMEVGGIRVSHMSHIEREMLLQLTATKGKRAPHIIKPLADAPAHDRAAEWVADHLAALDDATHLDDVEAVEQGGARAMSKLAKDRPELHERVVNAYAARRAALAQEGPADSQRVEGFVEDEA